MSKNLAEVRLTVPAFFSASVLNSTVAGGPGAMCAVFRPTRRLATLTGGGDKTLETQVNRHLGILVLEVNGVSVECSQP